MSSFDSLVREVQNSALGAGLVWQCAAGYEAARDDAAPCPLVLLFLPLPMVFCEEFYEIVLHTNPSSGLRKFVAKIQPDVLLTLQDRVSEFRIRTLESVRMAHSSRLVQLDQASAEILARIKTIPPTLDSSARTMLRNAHKLGVWFGSITPHEIGLLLRVRF